MHRRASTYTFNTPLKALSNLALVVEVRFDLCAGMAPKRKRNDVVSGEKAVRRSTRSRSSLAADAKSETNARSDVDLAARPELDSGQKNESILGNGQAAVRNTKKESKTATIGDKGHGESVKALRAEGVSAKQSTASGRSYWLMKAEPESRMEKGIDVKFSIDDLEACTEPEPWTGVRNHVAKNNMKAMKKGELAFFYHSNCKTPGIAGIMEIVQESSVDGMFIW